MVTDFVWACVKGEEWPAMGFQMFVDIWSGDPTYKDVNFICPKRHRFTLQEALSKGTIPQERADSILDNAKKIYLEYRKKILSPWTASDFLPNKEVIKLNRPCAKCGAKAESWVGDFYLCLEHRAAWHNYDNREAFLVMNRTSGRPAHLFWNAVFDRFLNDLPPFNTAELERLLENCREKAKGERKRTKRHS